MLIALLSSLLYKGGHSSEAWAKQVSKEEDANTKVKVIKYRTTKQKVNVTVPQSGSEPTTEYIDVG